MTKSGQSELERPIAIRPTSETVMYPYYAQARPTAPQGLLMHFSKYGLVLSGQLYQAGSQEAGML